MIMGKVTMAGTGGSADLDVITAAANDVLAGKVIVGPDGEPLTGTLALTGTAADSQVLAGQTYYNTDAKSKRTGTMLTMGGQTITPGAAQQTVSCAGKYMTGNIVVQASQKYGYYSGRVSTVGGKNFTNIGGYTYFLYYISVSPAFTPVICTAVKAESYNTTVSTPWGSWFVEAGVYDNKGFVSHLAAAMSKGSMIIPVTQPGDYNIWYAGYY